MKMRKLKKSGQVLAEQKLEEIPYEASHKGRVKLGLFVGPQVNSLKHLQARGSNLSVVLSGDDAQDDSAVMWE